MVNALVTVVIPTYQRFELCKSAIRSACRQTYDSLEVVVVEDGSESGVEGFVQQLRDSRLTYHRHPINRGLAAARNTGTRIASGHYVAFLDDDDMWLPEKLALQVELLETHCDAMCMVYCGGSRMSNGRIVNEWLPTAKGLMADHIYRGYTLDPSSMLVARDALLSIGGHSEEMTSCIDHDVWLKMAQAGFKMDFVPKGLVLQRYHGDSQMTTRLDERLQGIERFFLKWKPVVIAECGSDCWKAIEDVYHQQTVRTVRRLHSTKVLSSQEALEYLQRLFKLQSRSLTWADYLLYRAGRLSYTPVRDHKAELVRGVLIFPFRRLQSWARRRAPGGEA